MKERPILFSGEMVRALLDGRKTQTRRLVNPQPKWEPLWGTANGGNGAWLYEADRERTRDRWGMAMTPDVITRMATQEAYGWGVGAGCPYGVPGDRLWVRETFARGVPGCEGQGGVSYRADHNDPRGDGPANPMRWTPGIHMPRALSRIDLEVTAVRVERLRDISDEDVRAEGVTVRDFMKGYHVDKLCRTAAQECFRELWDEINGERAAWWANPWLWIVSFRRVRP